MLKLAIEPKENAYNDLNINLIPEDRTSMKQLHDVILPMTQIKNPSIDFVEATKAGEYADLPDTEFMIRTMAVTKLSENIFHQQQSVNICEAFANALQCFVDLVNTIDNEGEIAIARPYYSLGMKPDENGRGEEGYAIIWDLDHPSIDNGGN